jgi:hypothetical protein
VLVLVDAAILIRRVYDAHADVLATDGSKVFHDTDERWATNSLHPSIRFFETEEGGGNWTAKLLGTFYNSVRINSDILFSQLF